MAMPMGSLNVIEIKRKQRESSRNNDQGYRGYFMLKLGILRCGGNGELLENVILRWTRMSENQEQQPGCLLPNSYQEGKGARQSSGDRVSLVHNPTQ